MHNTINLKCLQATRNTVPVPRHWCYKRKYLQGKRGIEKAPFELPDFIRATGIEDMRSALQEKVWCTYSLVDYLLTWSTILFNPKRECFTFNEFHEVRSLSCSYLTSPTPIPKIHQHFTFPNTSSSSPSS